MSNSLSSLLKTDSLAEDIFLGKKTDRLDELDLISVQKDSWKKFLEEELFEILKEFFPIEDYTGKRFVLNLESIRFGEVRYPLNLCIRKKLTYDFPVYGTFTLLNKQSGKVRTQEVYLFSLPKMTEKGTFFINGIERAVINQLVRAPGVYFTAEIDRNTGATVYNAEIRPYVGAWIDVTIGKKDFIEMKVNRRRKFFATAFLKLFDGESDREIVSRYFSDIDRSLVEKYLLPTLKKDRVFDKDSAYLELFKKIKPGETPVLENAVEVINNMFFDPRRYSLSAVGRYKLNKKLNLSGVVADDVYTVTKEDFVAVLKYLMRLTVGQGSFDDIDHLSNRRLRRVGELVGMYGIRVGMLRAEREIKERMSLVSNEDKATPSLIVNPKSLSLGINSFFRSSQLSTIVDQTNVLSELDNLRRVTVSGPGGIQKERAAFSIRDVSSSQYSRICPIRTPEGINIGIVTYLALYAKVNDYGFLEAPYYKVVREEVGGKVRAKVSDEVVYMQADDEEGFYIAPGDVEVDEKGYITSDTVVCRYKGDVVEVSVDKVDYIDMSPRQLVGISAALLPFLANNDAGRALMGSHMQCQAVPLIKPRAPYVGTGMESLVSKATGRVVSAVEDGVVEYVDARKVVVRGKSGKVYSYELERFKRTNKDVIFDQKPVVSLGQKVKKNDLLVEGPGTENGNVALGQNVVVAFTSLYGYGYEDGFVISERLIKDDVLTSISSEEFVADVVDTKLGPEELTSDIPHVREESLKNLDKDGLVLIGSEVKEGDILVGKVAPKGEKELTAEERLLRAIFGEKAKDVKDTSLRVPYGKRGTVIDVEVIDSKKDPNELDPNVLKRVVVHTAQLRKITIGDKLAGRYGNKGVITKILPEADMPYLEDGTPVDVILSPASIIGRMNLGQILEAMLGVVAQYEGKRLSIPVFDRLSEDFIKEGLKKAGWPVDGRVVLYDGRTGKPYEKRVLVGIGYIMKLIHMVEDKFHARSIGPYSLITQQPLAGKAQMGGQRFGEMEVWALEAHRVPYTLQEMLTIKSDDVVGRMKTFEAILKGLEIPKSNVPESFKVLLKELNSLGLAIDPVE
ncbi:MAG: DNA-directed RNA polymerase subunit beta [Patescibacteria group bacterium]|nr:MAG: DNA-directed RNA polymerase subunit beta [Patescibacteria group bacterium]